MRNLHSLLLTFLLLLGLSSARADIVKLKNGTNYEGKITLQTPDLIKIEVPITDKIKETKTIAIADVADIIKTAPDDEAFAKIQKMVPTGSMLSSEAYRTMLTTGPEDFMSRFAGSKHKDKVVEIQKTLEEGGKGYGMRLGPGERRFDIGNYESYYQAFVEFALADPEYGESLRRSLEPLLNPRGQK